MFQKLFSLSFCVFSFLFSDAQTNDHLLRMPAISPDGSEIAFSFQGDIWKSSIDGGQALRLTVHESYEETPQWSPDGTKLAYVSNRFGNDDVFILPLSGNKPSKRLTYHSTGDDYASWMGNDQILFTTRRAFAEVERDQEIHVISANGGTPTRFFDALGDMPSVSPNGRFVAFTMGNCRVEREAYRGPANHNIWIYDSTNKSYTEVAKSDAQEVYPKWSDDNTLYYLSAENGKYNIHELSISKNGAAEGVAKPITNFTDHGIRYFDVSKNGNKIVYERGDQLFSISSNNNEPPKAIQINLFPDDKFYSSEFENFTSDLNDYSLSPNEKYIAFSVRGEIFVKENDKEKKRSARITNHSYRDQNPEWLNDSTLIFLSDRAGNKNLYLAKSSDSKEVNLFKTFKIEVNQLTSTPEEEASFSLSPDRKKISYQVGRGRLMVSDINENGQFTNSKTMLDGWDIPEGVAWSPDSKWLAYALEDLNFNEEIYIHPADNSTSGTNVSFHPRGDSNPFWSADGSKLGFQSIRNNGDSDIWFVWLKKEDWEKTQIDWEEDSDDDEPEEEKKDEKDDGEKKKDKKEVEPIQIDFEDIYERLEQVTSMPGNERNLLISKDGEKFFFTTNGGGRSGGEGDPQLMEIKWDGSDMKTLIDDAPIGGLSLDKSGKNIYYVKRGSLAVLKIDGAKSENLPFNAKMKIDFAEERKQIFDETWRSLNDGFYDPNFHGQNWSELRNYYEPIALKASTSQDFRTITNEMLGQLNASHMGLYGDNPEETQNDATGELGIEIKPVNSGVEITRIVINTPADKTKSKLMLGDIITHVNNDAVVGSENFYSLFNQLSNEKILLNITRNGQANTEITIRPTRSIRGDLYENWIKERKILTEKYSNGKLGYIHIQGMNWPSFERFERELAASGDGKEGIVIDVRFNGGGWTTDMLMAVLNVRQHSYTVPRGAAKSLENEHKGFKENYPYGERLPLSSWTRPSIALCNQNSYSNAEIFAHAYKTLDIGTLVGMPTFGAVISTGGQGLMDGSYVRMPFRAWYVKATEENMELGPAVPDILIENAPDSKAKGEDEQLKKSVDELLKEIGNK